MGLVEDRLSATRVIGEIGGVSIRSGLDPKFDSPILNDLSQVGSFGSFDLNAIDLYSGAIDTLVVEQGAAGFNGLNSNGFGIIINGKFVNTPGIDWIEVATSNSLFRTRPAALVAATVIHEVLHDSGVVDKATDIIMDAIEKNNPSFHGNSELSRLTGAVEHIVLKYAQNVLIGADSFAIKDFALMTEYDVAFGKAFDELLLKGVLPENLSEIDDLLGTATREAVSAF